MGIGLCNHWFRTNFFITWKEAFSWNLWHRSRPCLLLGRFSFICWLWACGKVVRDLVRETRLLLVFPPDSLFRIIWIFSTADSWLPGFQDVVASVNLVRTHEQWLGFIAGNARRLASLAEEAGNVTIVDVYSSFYHFNNDWSCSDDLDLIPDFISRSKSDFQIRSSKSIHFNLNHWFNLFVVF